MPDLLLAADIGATNTRCRLVDSADLARGLYAYGRLLLQRGDPQSRRQAERHLGEATRIATGLDMRHLHRELSALA